MKIFTKDKSLKQKIAWTIVILIVYRLCSHIPLPFIDGTYLKSVIDGNGTLGLLNTLTGGNLANMSVMALGITPYITSSIILQLMGTLIPSLYEMQREGSTGQEKYKRITIGLTVVFALIQSFFMVLGYGRSGLLTPYTWYSVLVPVLIMTGCVFVLSFMGQYISDHLFGNGISLILVTGILCSYLEDGQTLVHMLTYGHSTAGKCVLIIAAVIVIVLLFAFTVWLNYCEKDIHVVYSGKVSNMHGNVQKGVIPLKLIGGSVVPVIFASSLLTIPALIESFTKTDIKWLHIFNSSHWLVKSEWWASIGLILYFIMIIWFSYYYQHLNLNEREIAENLKKRGGAIAGIRPGKATELYLYKQMKYLTMLGGIGLCIVAFVPILATRLINVSHLSFLGTSIIIVVSVIDETFKKYDADSQGDWYGHKKGSFIRSQKKGLLK